MNKRKNGGDILPQLKAPALRSRLPENAVDTADEVYHEFVASLSLFLIVKKKYEKIADIVDVQLSKLKLKESCDDFITRQSLLKKVMVTPKLISSFNLLNSTMQQISLMKEEFMRVIQENGETFFQLDNCLNATLNQLPCIGVEKNNSSEECGRICEGSKKLGAALVELEIFAEATVDAVMNISELEKTCEMTGKSLRQRRDEASQVVAKTLSLTL